MRSSEKREGSRRLWRGLWISTLIAFWKMRGGDRKEAGGRSFLLQSGETRKRRSLPSAAWLMQIPPEKTAWTSLACPFHGHPLLSAGGPPPFLTPFMPRTMMEGIQSIAGRIAR